MTAVNFPPAKCAGEVESTAEDSYWTPSRPEKVTNMDVAQRKGKIALVSKRIKLVPERE